MRRLSISLCIWLLAGSLAWAGPDQGHGPASAVDAVIASELSGKHLVGAVVQVAHNGRVVYSRAAGYADREAGTPMREDSLFRLASMTKLLVSAAALALADQGKLSLDDPVNKWLPGFVPKLADGRAPTLRVHHLLTHTAGLTYGFAQPPSGSYHAAGVSDGLDCPDFDMDENLRRLAGAPLLYPPGAEWSYSLATDVLGEVLAKAAGQSLPEVVRAAVTAPLGMTDTAFQVRDLARLTTAYASVPPDVVRMGETFALPGPGGLATLFCPGRVQNPAFSPSGGAGMVGTAGDYLTFLEALRTGGSPILSKSAAKEMTDNQLWFKSSVRPGWGFGYGVAVLTNPDRAGVTYPKGSWYWGGAYGTSFWVDPQNNLSLVVLTNTVNAGEKGDFQEMVKLAVYDGLGIALHK